MNHARHSAQAAGVNLVPTFMNAWFLSREHTQGIIVVNVTVTTGADDADP